MKVTIDRETCISCAVCWEECPELFEQNAEDEWSQVAEGHREVGSPAKGEVPEELEDCVLQAAEDCPVEIIHIQL